MSGDSGTSDRAVAKSPEAADDDRACAARYRYLRDQGDTQWAESHWEGLIRWIVYLAMPMPTLPVSTELDVAIDAAIAEMDAQAK